jgi:arylsulfatase A-like enzyme
VVAYEAKDGVRPYSTDRFAQLAEGFIQRSADPVHNPTGKPWALFVWPNAPHLPIRPAPRHEDAAVPTWVKPPSFLEPDRSDKPPEAQPGSEKIDAEAHVRVRDGQLRLLMSVDQLVGRVSGAMDRLGMTERTWGIFMSDNGFLLGEHGLSDKNSAFEESARIPFRMRVPGRPGGTIDALVSNVDVAPTLLELAGDRGDHGIDGRSLVPLVRGQVDEVWEAVLIEGWKKGGYRALRDEDWKYVLWTRSGHEELYDLKDDPFELENVASQRRAVTRRLQGRLEAFYRA